MLAKGLDWYNPDTYAREAMAQLGCTLEEANSLAWKHGKDSLENAIKQGSNYVFETTLGANTIPKLLREAAKTHHVQMWFCGLESAELHIQRVANRVASGGHNIPEEKIRERWEKSRANLVGLIPYLTKLQVFDNSPNASPGQRAPVPKLLLDLEQKVVKFPDKADPTALAALPEWAKPLIQAAFDLAGIP